MIDLCSTHACFLLTTVAEIPSLAESKAMSAPPLKVPTTNPNQGMQESCKVYSGDQLIYWVSLQSLREGCLQGVNLHPPTSHTWKGLVNTRLAMEALCSLTLWPIIVPGEPSGEFLWLSETHIRPQGDYSN